MLESKSTWFVELSWSIRLRVSTQQGKMQFQHQSQMSLWFTPQKRPQFNCINHYVMLPTVTFPSKKQGNTLRKVQNLSSLDCTHAFRFERKPNHCSGFCPFYYVIIHRRVHWKCICVHFLNICNIFIAFVCLFLTEMWSTCSCTKKNTWRKLSVCIAIHVNASCLAGVGPQR